jgi:hypothetical protein
MKLSPLFLFYQKRDLAVWIVKVAEIPGFGGTGDDTGGSSLAIEPGFESQCEALIDPFTAKIAFEGGVSLEGIELASDILQLGKSLTGKIFQTVIGVVRALLVGTGYNAIAATDAFIGVHDDDAIFPFGGSAGGTDFNADGFLTMVATDRIDLLGYYWILTGLADQEPTPEYAWRQKMLLLAGDGAAIAADAPLQIDHHPPANQGGLLLSCGLWF